MRILWLDLSAGISGDMLLGALTELAGGPEPLLEAIAALGIEGLTVARRDVVRSGVGATKIDVLMHGHADPDAGHVEPPVRDDHGHGSAGSHHDHGPRSAKGHPEHGHGSAGDHGHHRLEDILRILSASHLNDRVRARAETVFRRLVAAEAEVHRIPADSVRLHEAGALDAIADVAGVCALVEQLAPDRILASPVNVGGGFIDCAHGRYPVPGPAAALLLRGCPVFSTGEDGELATPTGAALLTTLASGFGPLPPMRLLRTGCGAGSRETSPRPNIVRAFLGEEDAPGAAAVPSGHAGHASSATAGALPAVAVVECTVDDMNPQNYGWLIERLRAVGVFDCWLTAIQMKKNRPGVGVTVLCAPEAVEAVGEILFAETTTIGYRWRLEHRRELDRAFDTVETPWGRVRVKVASEGGEVRTAQPEYEDCRALAESSGVPLKEVQSAALAAWRSARAKRGTAGGAAKLRGSPR